MSEFVVSEALKASFSGQKVAFFDDNGHKITEGYVVGADRIDFILVDSYAHVCTRTSRARNRISLGWPRSLCVDGQEVKEPVEMEAAHTDIMA